MKVWVFSKDSRDKAIADWVQKQKDSGHPDAIAKADFIGRCLADMLDNSPSLFNNYQKTEES